MRIPKCWGGRQGSTSMGFFWAVAVLYAAVGCAASRAMAADFSYVIISTPLFAQSGGAAQQLATHRSTFHGNSSNCYPEMSVSVHTTTEIDAAGNGNGTASADEIKAFIHNLWNTLQPPLQYVVLFGIARLRRWRSSEDLDRHRIGRTATRPQSGRRCDSAAGPFSEEVRAS